MLLFLWSILYNHFCWRHCCQKGCCRAVYLTKKYEDWKLCNFVGMSLHIPLPDQPCGVGVIPGDPVTHGLDCLWPVHGAESAERIDLWAESGSDRSSLRHGTTTSTHRATSCCLARVRHHHSVFSIACFYWELTGGSSCSQSEYLVMSIG